MEKTMIVTTNDVETGEYLDLNKFTPLEREIILDFDLLDDEEKTRVLLFAAQLATNH